MTRGDDQPTLAPESTAAAETDIVASPWQILVADDDEAIHVAIRDALSGMRLSGRPLALLHAYSGDEAKRMVRENADIALILMDMAMETEQAGLDAVHHIREVLGNRIVRIVLRTCPAEAGPAREVVVRYDINDFKGKGELTADGLFPLLHASLAAYRDLLALEANRQGLEKILAATASLFQLQPPRVFLQGVVEQLAALAYVDGSAFLACRADKRNRLVAGTGRLAGAEGRDLDRVVGGGVLERVTRCLADGATQRGRDFHAAYITTESGDAYVLYLPITEPLSAARALLIDTVCRHLATVFDHFPELWQ